MRSLSRDARACSAGLADAGIAYEQAELAADVRRSMLWSLFALVVAAATTDQALPAPSRP